MKKYPFKISKEAEITEEFKAYSIKWKCEKGAYKPPNNNWKRVETRYMSIM